MLSSPFEQFEVSYLYWISVGSYSLGITNIVVFGIGVLCILLVGYSTVLLGKMRYVPSSYQLLWELTYGTLVGMLKTTVGKNGVSYINVLYVLFVLIGMMNILGMIPYSYTLTAQLVVALCLSMWVWLGKLFLLIENEGISMFKMFLPKGVPFGLVAFFVFIEIIGFFIPLISLAVSLFANMLSGHVLLNVLFTFTSSMFFTGGIWGLIQNVPLLVLLLLFLLEIGVALIQAYVFTLLVCIYIGDVENGGH